MLISELIKAVKRNQVLWMVTCPPQLLGWYGATIIGSLLGITLNKCKKTTEIREERLGKNLRQTQNSTSCYNLIHVFVALSELFNCFDPISSLS